CPEWTATSHLEAFLQLDLRVEPLFQVLPGINLIVKGSRAVPDGVEVALQDLVHQTLLVLEVVIKLALSGPGKFHDLIRARCPNPLFVKQLGSSSNNPEPRLSPFRRVHFHALPSRSRRAFPGSIHSRDSFMTRLPGG